MRTLEERYTLLPGTEQVPPPSLELLEEKLASRGESYRPRTRHLVADGRAKYTNRLFLESSPYLLQHAHNPVNWFPWGDEAFDLARKLNRPVLVSIGYATCHWCHVMEEESFEDESIAAYLNANFVAIKVDREERPDVDTVYMTAVHAMGMQGGWPLNVFTTPDRRPFYGGTYSPPDDRHGGIGFPSLLRRIRETYYAAPDRVTQAGLQLTEAIRAMLTPTEGSVPTSILSANRAIQAYRERFDPRHGGLIGAPKFPSSLPVRLLLRDFLRSGDHNSLEMVELTLRQMAAGGIYDQVGGGFHRYSVDAAWLVPHFEKMLYDNALLAVAYLEGYQATGITEFAQVAREILRYLQRDLAQPEGGFYSASDADSLTESGHREEGFFFTWTPEELEAVLGRERAAVVAACYGVTRAGNFEGRNILHRDKGLPRLAQDLSLAEEALAGILTQSRELLYQARLKRPQPLRDEKVLAAWNGLAVSAFARAGLVLDDQDFLAAAEKAADFLSGKMLREGTLSHSYQEGAAKGAGFLDDYACVVAGFLDLFEAGGDRKWLERARELSLFAVEQFGDRDAGGFFMTGPRHEQLISREKPAYDGVVPSGNSVMVMNLLRLGMLTGERLWHDQAERAFAAFSTQLASSPTALSEMLVALDFMQDLPREVVIVAPRGRPEAAEPLLAAVRRVYLPNRVLLAVTEGEELDRTAKLVPLVQEKKASGERAVAYLCENRACLSPTSDPEEFLRQLKQSQARSRR